MYLFPAEYAKYGAQKYAEISQNFAICLYSFESVFAIYWLMFAKQIQQTEFEICLMGSMPS